MRTETKPIGQIAGGAMTTIEPSARQQVAGLRKHLIISILLDVVLPLAGFYLLRGFGIGPLPALLLGGLLVLPGLGYSIRQQRKVNMLTVFTISLLVVGALMALVTGSARLLLVREAWLFLVLGLWMLGTVPTRRPFMMIMGRSIVIAKVGIAGLATYEARWGTEAAFRRATRILSAIWGLVFTLDAFVQVTIAYTLPIDQVPAVSTAQWVVVLAGLITFHIVYTKRKDLRA
jgi:hypothetical protein